MSKFDRTRPESSTTEHDSSLDAGGERGPMQMLVERFGAGGAKRVLQRRAQARAAKDADGNGVDAQAAAEKGLSGSAGALPHGEQIRKSFGPGHDISHVRAHTDGAAKEGAQAMGAEAFATGNQIAFAGAPDLHTAAHEAAHVVQQQAGVHLKGGVGQEGDDHERHADAVADAVVAGRSAAPLLDRYGKPSGGGKKIQRKVAMPGGKLLDKPTAENVEELLSLAGVDGGRTRAAREEAARLISDAETHSMGQATSKINRAASTTESRDAGAGAGGGGGEGMSMGQRAMKSESDKGEAQEEVESEADQSFDMQRERSGGDAPEPAHRQAQFAQLMQRTSGPFESAKETVEAIREKLPFTFEQQKAAGRVDIAVGALNVVWGAINIALTAATGGLATAITAPIGAAIASGGKAAQEKVRQQNNKATMKEAAKAGAKKGVMTGAAKAGAALEAGQAGAGHAGGAAAGGVVGELLPHMIPFVGGATSIVKGLKLIYDGIMNAGDIGPAADKQKLTQLDGVAAETEGNLAAMRAARGNPDFRGKESAIDPQIDALEKFIVAIKALRELYLERMVDQGKAPTRGRSGAVAEAAPPTRGRSGAVSGDGAGA